MKHLLALLLLTSVAVAQTTPIAPVQHRGGTLVSPTNFWTANASDINSVVAATATTNASLLTSGTLPDARLSTNVAFRTNIPGWVTSATWQTNPSAPVTTNATNLTAGILPDARLSTNVARMTNLPTKESLGLGAFTQNLDGGAVLKSGDGTEVIDVGDSIVFAAPFGFGGPNAADDKAATLDGLGLGPTNVVTFRDVLAFSVGAYETNGAGDEDDDYIGLTAGPFGGLQFGAGANSVAMRSNTRSAIGLGASWLTNNNVTNFRYAIGLGASWLTNSNAPAFPTVGGVLEGSVLWYDELAVLTNRGFLSLLGDYGFGAFELRYGTNVVADFGENAGGGMVLNGPLVLSTLTNATPRVAVIAEDGTVGTDAAGASPTFDSITLSSTLFVSSVQPMIVELQNTEDPYNGQSVNLQATGVTNLRTVTFIDADGFAAVSAQRLTNSGTTNIVAASTNGTLFLTNIVAGSGNTFSNVRITNSGSLTNLALSVGATNTGLFYNEAPPRLVGAVDGVQMFNVSTSSFEITAPFLTVASNAIFPALAGTNVRVATIGTNGVLGTTNITSGGGAGTKTLARFTARENQPPATNFATLDTRNSIAVLDFDDTAVESAVFVNIIPEAANLTNGFIVSMHWMATTATNNNVVWRTEFENGNTDLDTNSFATAVEATGTANATSGIVTVTSITNTNTDGLATNNLFRLRISRASTNASDTMSGDAELIAVEVRSAN